MWPERILLSFWIFCSPWRPIDLQVCMTGSGVITWEKFCARVSFKRVLIVFMISLLNDGSPNPVCLKFYVLQWNMVNKKRHSSRVYRPSSQMMFPQSSVLSPLRSSPLQTNCCPYQSDITSPHPNHHPQVSSRHPSPWSGLLRAVIVSVLVKLLKLRWKVLCLSFCKTDFIYQNMYLDVFQASHNTINSLIISY